MSHGAKIRSFSRWQEAQCEEWRKLLSHSRASWTRVAPGLSSKYPGRIFSTAESKYPSFNIKLLTTSRDKRPCFSCQEQKIRKCSISFKILSRTASTEAKRWSTFLVRFKTFTRKILNSSIVLIFLSPAGPMCSMSCM